MILRDENMPSDSQKSEQNGEGQSDHVGQLDRVLRVAAWLGSHRGGADSVAGGAAWVTPADADGLPAEIAELVEPRRGWSPAAWRARLLDLADRCEAVHPDRAAELRRAAEAMMPGRTGTRGSARQQVLGRVPRNATVEHAGTGGQP